jgi:hypothetical protein
MNTGIYQKWVLPVLAVPLDLEFVEITRMWPALKLRGPHVHLQ